MTKNKFLSLILITWIFTLLFQCQQPNKTVIITVINEMQPCEEHNIFYRIVDSDQPLETIKDSRDSLVLFTFSDSLDNKQNYDLFYPIETKYRYEIKVKGHFLKEKVSKNHSYGCPESSKFKISEIIEIKDVSQSRDFPINNQ